MDKLQAIITATDTITPPPENQLLGAISPAKEPTPEELAKEITFDLDELLAQSMKLQKSKTSVGSKKLLKDATERMTAVETFKVIQYIRVWSTTVCLCGHASEYFFERNMRQIKHSRTGVLQWETIKDLPNNVKYTDTLTSRTVTACTSCTALPAEPRRFKEVIREK